MKPSEQSIQTTTKGWVVAALPHPTTNKTWIDRSSFADTKHEAIQIFMNQKDYKRKDWERWKRDYNFKVHRAEQSITIKP